ncbi:MAG TPA: hypothetical protein PLN86_15710, partial [Candidatus Hydrogenedentes bacterium]|nr:hypothetical protein [Candidatus Hydrogenedentota bacterium]
MMCISCGYEYASSSTDCPLCNGRWQGWELLFAPLKLDDLRAQVMGWLGQLPSPAVIEWSASPMGLRVRLYLPPHTAVGVVQAWAAMTGQHSRWRALGEVDVRASGVAVFSSNRLPSILASAKDSDPLLAIASQLISAARECKEASLRLWVLGREDHLQERLRKLSAYSYGTEGGVEGETPNPWKAELVFLRALLFLGIISAGLSGGLWSAGFLAPLFGVLGLIAGGVLFVASAFGLRDWLDWRSIPKEILERRIQEPLFHVALSLSSPIILPLLDGKQYRFELLDLWPEMRGFGFPLPAGELAGLIAPLQLGEGSGLLDRAVWQDVPAPPPSQPLLDAGFKIGKSVATGGWIGVDPDGHGMATGGSRSGKSSFVFAMLEQLLARGA